MPFDKGKWGLVKAALEEAKEEEVQEAPAPAALAGQISKKPKKRLDFVHRALTANQRAGALAKQANSYLLKRASSQARLQDEPAADVPHADADDEPAPKAEASRAFVSSRRNLHAQEKETMQQRAARNAKEDLLRKSRMMDKQLQQACKEAKEAARLADGVFMTSLEHMEMQDEMQTLKNTIGELKKKMSRLEKKSAEDARTIKKMSEDLKQTNTHLARHSLDAGMMMGDGDDEFAQAILAEQLEEAERDGLARGIGGFRW